MFELKLDSSKVLWKMNIDRIPVYYDGYSLRYKTALPTLMQRRMEREKPTSDEQQPTSAIGAIRVSAADAKERAFSIIFIFCLVK